MSNPVNSADPLDALAFMGEQERTWLTGLGDALINGSVVLFAGAGLSMNARRKDGGGTRLPGWWALVKQLRAGLEEGLAKEQDVLKIADYYRATYGHNALIEAVARAIPDDEFIPGPVHRRIVDLDFQEIITTNFDTLIERAFEEAHIVPQVVVEGRDLAHSRRPPRIIKMNGCLKRNPSDIVITGDDFLGYADRRRLIQVFITRCFVESRVLFIGFSLDDPAFKSILAWVQQRLDADAPLCWSLQLNTTRTQQAYWRQRGVQLINLSSGAPTDLGPEGKIMAVLDALSAMQRQARPRPGHRPRKALAELTSRGAADVSDLQAAFDSEPGSDARWRAQTMIRAACRLDASVDPGLTLEASAWRPLAIAADAWLSEKTDTADAVLLCDLSLKLLIASAMGTDDAEDPLSPARAGQRLLLAASRLGEAAARLRDPGLRARALMLISLVAPVGLTHTLVEAWSNAAGTEGGLTAELDRLPLLSFHGVLSLHPALYQQAAEQLRLHGLPGEDNRGTGAAREAEASLRYLNLIRAVGGQVWDWPVSHLYRARLERAAGQLVLERDAVASPTASATATLLDLTRALARGALFTGPAPDELSAVWGAVERAVNRGRVGQVPWIATVLLTLPFEGEALISQRGHLLRAAWRAHALDATTLIEAAALRLGGTGFDGFPARNARGRPASDQGVGRYACGLAALLRWLAEQIDAEITPAEGTGGVVVEDLRQRFLQALSAPLQRWLVRTPYAEVRTHLLHLWATADRWTGAPRAEVVQAWVDHHLDAQIPRHTLQLALLDPPGEGAMAVDRDRVRILLALAQAQHRRGTAFRHDLQRWLIRHAAAGSLDEETLEILARHLAECLRGDADGRSFYWLSLAARIRASDVLTGGVAVHLGRADAPLPLVRFVSDRLNSLDGAAERRWSYAREGSLACFVPFAEAGEVDEVLARYIGDLRPQEAFSADGREGACALLAARLHRNRSEEASEDAPDPIAADVRALTGWIEQGATGRGRLGRVADALSEPTRHRLQDNLTLALDQEGRERPEEIVRWIGRTLSGAPAGLLPDLEAALIEGAGRRHHPLASACLEAVVDRIKADEAFLERHREALRRTTRVMMAREGHRQTSRFVSRLGWLIAAVEPAFSK